MKILLKKQPQKYLAEVYKHKRDKLLKALEKLSKLEGDIAPLAGAKNLYRLKTHHYRIIFERRDGALVITVIEINTRTNIHYKKY